MARTTRTAAKNLTPFLEIPLIVSTSCGRVSYLLRPSCVHADKKTIAKDRYGARRMYIHWATPRPEDDIFLAYEHKLEISTEIFKVTTDSIPNITSAALVQTVLGEIFFIMGEDQRNPCIYGAGELLSLVIPARCVDSAPRDRGCCSEKRSLNWRSHWTIPRGYKAMEGSFVVSPRVMGRWKFLGGTCMAKGD